MNDSSKDGEFVKYDGASVLLNHVALNKTVKTSDTASYTPDDLSYRVRINFYRAGAVANEGIARKIGDRNSDRPNKIAVVAEVSPVLPPSDTPEALSTNVVVVVVPSTAPTVVATASAISAPLIFGRRPSSSNIPAFVDTPISVPIVSNISTNKNAKMTTIKFKENIPLKSSFPNTGMMLGIVNPLLKSGSRL